MLARIDFQRMPIVRNSFVQESDREMRKIIPLFRLQRELAVLFEWARVDPSTLTRYRALAGISKHARTCSDLNAKLLIAALMFRPRSKRDLKDIYMKREEEIAEIFVSASTREDIQIEEPVPPSQLASEIAKAGGVYRSPRTLKRYAAIISRRSGLLVVYPSDEDYPPEVATAFARLSLEMVERQRLAGEKAAAKRWSVAS